MDLIRRIGERAKRFRMRKGFKQVDVARRAQMDRTTLHRVEHGLLAGLSVVALVRLAGALDVSVATLLEDAEPSDEDEPTEHALQGRLGELLRTVRPKDHAALAAVIEGWISQQQPRHPAGSLDCASIRLDQLGRLTQGPLVPSVWLTEEYSAPDARGERAAQRFVDLQMQAARARSDRWGRLAAQHAAVMRPCFSPSHIRPLLAGDERGGMIYLVGADRAMRADMIFANTERVMIEPRTLVAMCVPRTIRDTGATQDVYCLFGLPGKRRAALTTSVRISAFFLTIEPHHHAPDVRWFDAGYRPRLAQIAALPVPRDIATDTAGWCTVDAVAGQIATYIDEHEVSPPGHLSPFDRLMWWRQHVPHRGDLVKAVTAAIEAGPAAGGES